MVPDNIQLPTPRVVIENSEGYGGLERQNFYFKRKYEAKLDIPGEGGGGWEGLNQKKKHTWRRYGYFLEPHIPALEMHIQAIMVDVFSTACQVLNILCM